VRQMGSPSAGGSSGVKIYDLATINLSARVLG
jgi:hypothetical protein